jgi:isoleucyl-tRNA synthetase
VLWQITEALVRLVAPILSFTADEIWEHLPTVEGREKSVHLALFPKPEEIFSGDYIALLDEWKKLFEIREAVLRKLELKRQNKEIGKGLEAAIEIEASGEALSLLQRYNSILKEFMNVSDVTVNDCAVALVNAVKKMNAPLPDEEYEEVMKEVAAAKNSPNEVILSSLAGHIEIRAIPATGHKCARCWNFMPTVSNYGIWENVCPRCQSALEEMGIARPEAAE